MKKQFENKPKLGIGIYTVPDIAQILRIPYYKANRWISEYWDNRFGRVFQSKYSWTDGKSKAISFHTLIELYIYIQFSEAGVKTKEILQAHKILSNKFNTPFPFATSYILDHISTDGSKIFFMVNDAVIYNIDGTNQLNLKFIESFFKKIDFTDDNLASRLWPLGRKKSVVIDPSHQFGQPVIDGTNIIPSTLFNLFQAGEPVDFIASIYGLKQKEVRDAIAYCKSAA